MSKPKAKVTKSDLVRAGFLVAGMGCCVLGGLYGFMSGNWWPLGLAFLALLFISSFQLAGRFLRAANTIAAGAKPAAADGTKGEGEPDAAAALGEWIRVQGRFFRPNSHWPTVGGWFVFAILASLMAAWFWLPREWLGDWLGTR